MAEDNYIRLRFRRVDDWVRAPYMCGWPNFELADYKDGRGIVYGHFLLKDDVVDWQDVPAATFGNLSNQPLRARFSRASTFAGTLGYQHGFPNFQESAGPAGTVFGTYLIVPGTCEFRDVPATELSLLPDPTQDSMDKWFWGASRFAARAGFAAAMPTGHIGGGGGEPVVCGVLLFPASSVQWVDIPGSELGIESGIAEVVRGTTRVDVTLEPPVGGGGVRSAVTATGPCSNSPDTEITGVRNLYSQDVRLTHVPRRASTGASGSPVTGVIPAGMSGQPGRTVTNFNGGWLEGEWLVQIPVVSGVTGRTMVSFEITWTTVP